MRGISLNLLIVLKDEILNLMQSKFNLCSLKDKMNPTLRGHCKSSPTFWDFLNSAIII